MSLIETHKLTKIYKSGEKELIVLNQLDLRVEQGEVVALVGSSGTGKTTLMHVLGCLDSPTSGKYLLNGKNVLSFNRKQLAFIRNSQIGFIFQNYHLLNHLNAKENVILPQVYGGVAEKQARQRAEELLQFVGLGDRLMHYPHQLSGGQKQRVAIARALAMKPKILLADEPTGNLDQENTKRIIDLLFMINKTHETTLMIVTHEREIANQAKRCITLENGRIISDTQLIIL